MVISSIGSVPERIKGIGMKGEYYTYKSWDTGEYEGIPGVFGLGNVVTGQGNIRASFVHGQFVAKHLIENYLGVGDSRDISGAQAPAAAKGEAGAPAVQAHPEKKAPLAPGKVKATFDRGRRPRRGGRLG